MRHVLALAILGAAVAPSGVEAAKPSRLLTLSSYLDFERVSDPQISPDGTQVVYTREWVDKQKDKYTTGRTTRSSTPSCT